MSEKQRYLKITRPEYGSYCIGTRAMACEELRLHFEEGAEGEFLTFKIVEMTEEEFKALPEFNGW